MTPSQIAVLVSFAAACMALGFVLGMQVGGKIWRDGKTRKEARAQREIDRYLDRFGDFSTQQLRDAVAKNRRSVVQDVSKGYAWSAKHEREVLVKMQKEIDRRIRSGEVEGS